MVPLTPSDGRGTYLSNRWSFRRSGHTNSKGDCCINPNELAIDRNIANSRPYVDTLSHSTAIFRYGLPTRKKSEFQLMQQAPILRQRLNALNSKSRRYSPRLLIWRKHFFRERFARTFWRSCVMFGTTKPCSGSWPTKIEKLCRCWPFSLVG